MKKVDVSRVEGNVTKSRRGGDGDEARSDVTENETGRPRERGRSSVSLEGFAFSV